jgi:hypothetical protein
MWPINGAGMVVVASAGEMVHHGFSLFLYFLPRDGSLVHQGHIPRSHDGTMVCCMGTVIFDHVVDEQVSLC